MLSHLLEDLARRAGGRAEYGGIDALRFFTAEVQRLELQHWFGLGSEIRIGKSALNALFITCSKSFGVFGGGATAVNRIGGVDRQTTPDIMPSPAVFWRGEGERENRQNFPARVILSEGEPMKADVERTIPSRVFIAFEDILAEASSASRRQILQGAENMVKAVWMGKIYAALPKDKTTVPEYFLDAELEQFLNEAIEECHARISAIAARAKDSI